MRLAEAREYCTKVVKGIRYWPCRGRVEQELLDHIEDMMEELQGQGLTQEEAEHRAVAAMGDPEEVGRQLDRQHGPLAGWTLFFTQVAAVLAGGFAALAVFGVALGVLGSLPGGLYRNYEKEAVWVQRLDERQQLGNVAYQLHSVCRDEQGRYTILYSTFSTDPGNWGIGWNDAGLVPYDAEIGLWGAAGATSGSNFAYYHACKPQTKLTDGKTQLMLRGELWGQTVEFTIPLEGGEP